MDLLNKIGASLFLGFFILVACRDLQQYGWHLLWIIPVVLFVLFAVVIIVGPVKIALWQLFDNIKK